MAKAKFDSRQFNGKSRVYRPVAGTHGISRLWVWSEERSEYIAPERGKAYLARRHESVSGGGRVRRFQYFVSLEAARQWQAFAPVTAEAQQPEASVVTGPGFTVIATEWRRRMFPSLAEGTRLQYERMLNRHFGSLLRLTVHEITPRRVDEWIDELKSPQPMARVTRRKAFDHELTLLGTVLRYYENYYDDPDFRFPIKKRHREAIRLAKPSLAAPKDLSEEEFLKFRDCLLQGSHGPTMAVLATVQYYQALRISEAAGIYWEDVKLLLADPVKSRLAVVRSVFWPRKKGMKSYVKAGFKNSESNDGVKEQPLFPEAFRALALIYKPGCKGLIFGVDGRHLEYRSIQFAYDRAFKAAGLMYTGTHVMRHGGCRRIYNRVPDTAVAQQLLGNANLQATLVYAKRHKGALTEVANDEWEASDKLDADRKCSQIRQGTQIDL